MTYDEDVSPRERKISRGLAIGMHVALLVLLIFGVSWQRRQSEPAAVVDLWSSMAPPKQEAPAPPPRPVPKVEPKPEPKAPPPPPPKPEVKAIPKADIALKEKLEKERKVKEKQELEKKKQQEIDRRKEDDAKKLKARQQEQQVEAKKKDEEKKKLDKERAAQDAEAKKLAAEKQALADKLAKQAASAQAGEIDKYRRLIQDRVRRNIVEPPNLQGNPEVEFEVRLLPGGDVLETSLRLKRSSGNAAYDQAVERAILKSSPLPLPSDPSMFNTFRDLNLKIRPKE
ncbi:MAG: protein TolA [Betaproteobacteria bacterium]|nr:protein TolA [Betaproteobacteria bacterium]